MLEIRQRRSARDKDISWKYGREKVLEIRRSVANV